ncbi:MAG TPA: DUF4432 family protein [Chloroflexota bacterium]|nr:DUF4432 family protein [Chloroflexota bacterium]
MSDSSSPSFAPGSPRSQAVTIEEGDLPWGPPAGGTAPAGGAPAGWRSVTLRNGQLEVVLLPEKGGEIYALRSLEHGVDLLWKSPWGPGLPPLPSASGEASQTAWLDHYGGGWQELFPNAGAACTVDGAAHPFHGEASVVPWSYRLGTHVTPDREELPQVQLEVRLARSPFRLQKRISLDSRRPLLHVWERVTNESRQRRPYIWGQHPAFGAPFLAGGCRLDVPAGGYVAADPQVSPRSPVVPGARSRWPHVTSARAAGAAGQQKVDLSVVPPPEAEVDTLGFLVDLSAGWYALSNEAMGLGFALTWPLEVFSCLWLWQELGGTLDYPWYGAAYVMGVEPHTSCPADGLAAAVQRGNARSLGPGESVEVELRAVLFTPQGRVNAVSPEGDVAFASP